MQIEKRQGYYYEHAVLPHLAGDERLPLPDASGASDLNTLALASKRVIKQVRRLGVQTFLRWVRETCANRWLTSYIPQLFSPKMGNLLQQMLAGLSEKYRPR